MFTIIQQKLQQKFPSVNFDYELDYLFFSKNFDPDTTHDYIIRHYLHTKKYENSYTMSKERSIFKFIVHLKLICDQFKSGMIVPIFDDAVENIFSFHKCAICYNVIAMCCRTCGRGYCSEQCRINEALIHKKLHCARRWEDIMKMLITNGHDLTGSPISSLTMSRDPLTTTYDTCGDIMCAICRSRKKNLHQIAEFFFRRISVTSSVKYLVCYDCRRLKQLDCAWTSVVEMLLCLKKLDITLPLDIRKHLAKYIGADIVIRNISFN